MQYQFAQVATAKIRIERRRQRDDDAIDFTLVVFLAAKDRSNQSMRTELVASPDPVQLKLSKANAAANATSDTPTAGEAAHDRKLE